MVKDFSSGSPSSGKTNDVLFRPLSAHVDEISQADPDRVYAYVAIQQVEIPREWRGIKFCEFAQAINYMSKWIQERFGIPKEKKPLAYVATNDIRYSVFMLACMKTNHYALLLSPRISSHEILHLMNLAKCEQIIYSEEREVFCKRARETNSQWYYSIVPSFDEMLNEKSRDGFDERALTAVLQPTKSDVAWMVHTSGTTGLPKLVPMKHGYLHCLDQYLYVPVPPNRCINLPSASIGGKPLLSMFPFFHLTGVFMITESIFHSTPFVLCQDQPMTAERFIGTISTAKPKGAWLTPSVLEELSAHESALTALSDLEVIFFAGAPLSPETGDKVSNITTLCPIIGSSEVGGIPSLIPSRKELWNYFEWASNIGVVMENVQDDLYELVIQKDPESSDVQSIFHTFPDMETYRTKDLFTPHPENSNLWKYDGRFDDIIVFSNGEKFNPVAAEKILEGHPLITHAILAGQQQSQITLLVEPNWDRWDESKTIDDLIPLLKPTIEETNRTVPAYAQIDPSRIIMASKAKKFKTTIKGSKQRRHILLDFAEDIKDCDCDVIVSSACRQLDWTGGPEARDSLRNLIFSLTGLEGLKDEDNLFSAGMDSLQASKLANEFKSSFKLQYAGQPQPQITPQNIYSHPTVAQLLSFMSDLKSGRCSDSADADFEPGNQARSDKISRMVERYTKDFRNTTVSDTSSVAPRNTILLTGSTGSLGNYILDRISGEMSDRVICLTRDDAAESRVLEGLKDRGLAIDSSTSVLYKKADLSLPNLGLDPETYENMTATVTIVIHNAWEVNFLQTLEAFEKPHLQGVRHLIDFCLACKAKAQFHFVSSISSVGLWNLKYTTSAPEEIVLDPEVPLEQGYAESKFVAEHICAEAVSSTGLPVFIHRVGQLCGPRNGSGVWNRKEWMPSLISTSKSIGYIPDTLGRMKVDWIPVDTMGEILAELVIAGCKHGGDKMGHPTVFNLVSPRASSWDELVPPIQSRYGLKMIAFKDWIELLENVKDPSEDDLKAMPALKILDFYRTLIDDEVDGKDQRYSPATNMGEQYSPSLRNLPPLSSSLMSHWLDLWNFEHV